MYLERPIIIDVFGKGRPPSDKMGTPFGVSCCVCNTCTMPRGKVIVPTRARLVPPCIRPAWIYFNGCCPLTAHQRSRSSAPLHNCCRLKRWPMIPFIECSCVCRHTGGNCVCRKRYGQPHGSVHDANISPYCPDLSASPIFFPVFTLNVTYLE